MAVSRPWLVGLVVLAGLAIAPSAGAEGLVYWSYGSPGKIAVANADGSSARILDTTGARLYGPAGLAIDSPTQRVYWTNQWDPISAGNPPPECGSACGIDGGSVSYASLAGGGGGTLDMGTAPVDYPTGIGIDTEGRRALWANLFSASIAFARLDGGGGGKLDTAGATVSEPSGVIVDPVSRRVYWASWGADTISYADLNGSGGHDLPIAGSGTIDHPSGVAIDPVGRRIYWGNYTADKISSANLDGSGAIDLNTGAAVVQEPDEVAVDPVARRIYWTNNGSGAVSYANLDGGGGGNLIPDVLDGFSHHTSGLALMRPPSPKFPPSIQSSGVKPGSVLSCDQNGWNQDLPEASLYQAPANISLQWYRNEVAMPGARGDSLLAGETGTYRCEATGFNQAGSTTRSSADSAIFAVGRLMRNRARGIGRLTITVPPEGAVRLQGAGVVPRRYDASGGQLQIPIVAAGKKLKALRNWGRVRLLLLLEFEPKSGSTVSRARTVTLQKLH